VVAWVRGTRRMPSRRRHCPLLPRQEGHIPGHKPIPCALAVIVVLDVEFHDSSEGEVRLALPVCRVCQEGISVHEKIPSEAV
jgi:hypothetical protein